MPSSDLLVQIYTGEGARDYVPLESRSDKMSADPKSMPSRVSRRPIHETLTPDVR